MIEIIEGELTALDVDAIVNAANEQFRGGGGLDGAIHRAAGPELLEECRLHPRLPTGEAILTRGYRLPAKWIIHTVGPVWRGGAQGEPALLRRAYESVFRVAREHGSIRTIVLPALSTGIFGYPKHRAAPIAVEAMRRHEEAFERVIACFRFDEESPALYRRLLDAVQS